MRFDVVTIFPAMFGHVFENGVVGRGIERGIVQLRPHDLRDFTHDRHRQVDDMPFGGGPGMVIKPEPVFEAVESIRPHNPGPVVLMEPWGERLDQKLAAELAAESGLIIVCGRYEGIDDRVRTGLASREISIGDYVLSGGEIQVSLAIRIRWRKTASPKWRRAGPSSPGPRTTGGWWSPTCSFRATTPASSNGAAARRLKDLPSIPRS